jgi:TonB family protein
MLLTFLLIAQATANAHGCDQDALDAYYKNPETFELNRRGKRSLEEVSFVIDCHRKDVYTIYARHLKNNKTLAGQMVIGFTVHSDGHISDVSTVSSTVNSTSFENDLLDVIKSMKFNARDVAVSPIRYPFDFVPE